MSGHDEIKSVAIYPPLGIARVGNAPDEYYVAAEIPGQAPQVGGGYKDAKGRIKKQVVRFRVYGLNSDGEAVRELTVDDETQIEWRVHVANRKAAWYQFNNALDLKDLAVPSAWRNAKEKDRDQLVIDPKLRCISGRSADSVKLDGGTFYGKQVPLGELRTDDEGRLLFFGGDGHSASKDGSRAVTFANNDGWHDDTSDGTVWAKVVHQGEKMEAEPAMVATTPPNFGQGLFGVVTMLDVVRDLYIRSGWEAGPTQVNFWEHIYPIFERMTQTQWVNHGFFMLFGQNSPSDLTDPGLVKQLSDPSAGSRPVRERLFTWFRDPSDDVYRPVDVPPFYGDAFGEYEAIAEVDLSVTRTQYEWLKQWADGNFSDTRPPQQKPFDDLEPQQQIECLNRVGLEECLGGEFHPGIEITWPFRQLMLWEKPYRLKTLPEGGSPSDDYGPLLAPRMALGPGGPLDGSGPGSLTRWMGVPWQTDEASCLAGYDPSTYLFLPSFWAARVPNQVLSEDSFKRLTDASLNVGQRLKHFDYRQDWLRDLGTQYQTRINNMVANWWELGIVAEHPSPANEIDDLLPGKLWVESDRGPFNKDDPTFEQVLRAESAAAEEMQAAERVVQEVAAREVTERPQRTRRTFRREER